MTDKENSIPAIRREKLRKSVNEINDSSRIATPVRRVSQSHKKQNERLINNEINQPKATFLNYPGDRLMSLRSMSKLDGLSDSLSRDFSRPKYVELNGSLSAENLIDKVFLPTNGRILRFTKNMKSPTQNEKLQIMLSKNRNVTKPKLNRIISRHCEKTFDAPNIPREELFSNITDWSQSNSIAICLNNEIYTMNCKTHKANLILQASGNEGLEFTCLKWVIFGSEINNKGKSDSSSTASRLLYGTINGEVNLVCLSKRKIVKKYRQSSELVDNMTDSQLLHFHPNAVTCLAYTRSKVSIGLANGIVEHYDVNAQFLCNGVNHNEPILKMKWNKSNQKLAVMSHSKIYLYDYSFLDTTNPLIIIDCINNCDIDWSPHRFSHILIANNPTNASNDAVLQIFDTTIMKSVKKVNVNSKVTSVYYNEIYDQILVGTNDIETNQTYLQLMDGQTFKQLTAMEDHTDSIKCIRPSPDNETICSLGLDETLRLWKCFARTNKHQPPEIRSRSKSEASLNSLLSKINHNLHF